MSAQKFKTKAGLQVATSALLECTTTAQTVLPQANTTYNIGSTAMTLDVEVKYTLPHMVSLGGIGIVDSAVEAARKSVEPRGKKGPGVAQLTIFGGLVTYPPCIVTDYELDASYDHGAFGHDSRVIILRLKMEEYHGL